MKRFIIYICTTLTIIISSVCFIVQQKEKEEPEFGEDNPEGFAQYMRYITGTPDGSGKSYGINYRLREYNEAVKKINKFKSTKAKLNWIERGPGNVGGRTRALIVHPADTTYSTWYAAAVSGGIWRTTDKGKTWENLTQNIPVLSTTALAVSKSNDSILYAGTGEGFGGYGMVIGNGIFKSTERGNAGTWLPLVATQYNEDFKYVNRIIVDYDSEDTVLAATNSGIFKSVDGGNSWYEVYQRSGHKVQHIIADPVDFNILYAGVNRWGIIKSTNKGETWFDINNGIVEAKRFELAVSPVNTDKIFASVEGYGNQTIVYYSYNKGETWHQFLEQDDNSFNFLRSQGWFDNTIVCHPYDEDIIYLGGVYMGKIEFNNVTQESDAQVLRVDTVGTANMLEFVRFGGRYFDGSLAIGSDENGEDIKEEDWTSVEIRIGHNYSQKAHRFVVPEGSGAGVPPENYSYADYIDVPFEVWDTENNKQLMVSFRDNEGDGEFTVIEHENDKPALGREYVFVHAVDYNSVSPDVDVAKEAGYTYKLLYFLWPVLPPDSTWNVDELDGKIIIKYGKFIYQKGKATVLADDNRNKNLHVDHHQLIALKTNEEEKSFVLLNSNDGGLGISEDAGNTWEQFTDGYNTTQFYGVARRPGSNDYIGGMQDNGTWMSEIGNQQEKDTKFTDELEGDGFEVIWHPEIQERIIGSTYSNYFSVTINSGIDWEFAYDGIDGDGPFVSRLSNHVDAPNILYAVGGRGVYQHFNFGLGRQQWILTRPGQYFSYENIPYTHDVEVSLANPDIVWAGTAMYKNPELRIYVSNDGGGSYKETALYHNRKLGFITSIATHPVLDSTAFVLFSQPEQPKILRTNDLGDTWQDISGFGDNDSSSNGFPDVIVYTLLVHPEDTSTLWAGTEIGLFESNNSGQDWYYADNGLPAVSIFQLKVSQGQVLVATHGRGIWTLDLSNVNVKSISDDNLNWKIYPNPVNDDFTVEINEYIQNVYQLRILSLDGKVLQSQKVYNKNTNINVSDLAPGNYLVQLVSNGKVFRKKILKR